LNRFHGCLLRRQLFINTHKIVRLFVVGDTGDSSNKLKFYWRHNKNNFFSEKSVEIWKVWKNISWEFRIFRPSASSVLKNMSVYKHPC